MQIHSHKAITVHKGVGWLGGTLILFDTCVGSGIFFKFLNYINLGGGGVRNIDILGVMKILWIFFGGEGGHDKIGLVLGVSSRYFSVFFMVNVQSENIFAWQKFGVLDIPDIFWRQTVDAGPNPTYKEK